MVINSTMAILGIASSNPVELEYATDRLVAEHEELRSRLKMIEAGAKEVILVDDPVRGVELVQDLRKQTSLFVKVLERHSEWEEHDLFPFLSGYFHRESVPSILPSFWVLEKDHELGMSFIESFQEMSKVVRPTAGQKQLAEAAGHLVQACLILNDHLTMEEQLVFPLAEKVLTDLESFFS
ncbi:hemerythrin domain-containing protein [Paenibacillus sp. Soil750]|uniref:hemerythrin domain-containing protein n=1 Tax=Paenibacillus sp. Soil750 TaxID=1736398 RepID=UPI0006F4EDDC|nr:hemerythrin domain-containing protein [Paenibacillus sp. Soil750]KRE57808.1 hypothetical protein ASL11_29665 [Paenibacillus sp. Soil750]